MSENENIKCHNKDFKKSNIHGNIIIVMLNTFLKMGLEISK